MVNSVRELNTDVNFARLVAQFEQTDDRLRSSTDKPVAHIRLDTSGVRGWADFYDRYCSACRAASLGRVRVPPLGDGRPFFCKPAERPSLYEMR